MVVWLEARYLIKIYGIDIKTKYFKEDSPKAKYPNCIELKFNKTIPTSIAIYKMQI